MLGFGRLKWRPQPNLQAICDSPAAAGGGRVGPTGRVRSLVRGGLLVETDLPEHSAACKGRACPLACQQASCRRSVLCKRVSGGEARRHALPISIRYAATSPAAGIPIIETVLPWGGLSKLSGVCSLPGKLLAQQSHSKDCLKARTAPFPVATGALRARCHCPSRRRAGRRPSRPGLRSPLRLSGQQR